jgi:hypothetical protein
MGATVVSSTIQSHTIANDDDVDVRAQNAAGVSSVAFNSMGTGPALTKLEGGPGRIKLKVTAGTGSPAIAANNVVVSIPGGRTPRKVYLASSVAAPGFHVASVAAGSVTLGTKVAPVASTVYDLELIVLF